MSQISIFEAFADLVPVEDRVPFGTLEDENLIGRELRFKELKDFVGKKVVLVSEQPYTDHYSVVKITKFWEEADAIYKRVRELPERWANTYEDRVNDYIHDHCGAREAMACYELECTCDSVSYARKERELSGDCGVSEMYCSNGRCTPLWSKFLCTFHELKAS